MNLKDRSEGSGFHTTRWSLIRASGASEGDRRAALDWLCRTCWQPLYRHARMRGLEHEQALDATQGFFTSLLAKEPFSGAVQEDGRFRAWLLSGMNHYLSDLRDHDRAAKRGGRTETIALEELARSATPWEPVDTARTPDQEFDRNWALALMERAMATLEKEYTGRGAGEQFRLLSPCLAGRPAAHAYEAMGAAAGTSANSVAVAVRRMRVRFREHIRELVRETVGSAEELEDELAVLFAALRG